MGSGRDPHFHPHPRVALNLDVTALHNFQPIIINRIWRCFPSYVHLYLFVKSYSVAFSLLSAQKTSFYQSFLQRLSESAVSQTSWPLRAFATIGQTRHRQAAESQRLSGELFFSIENLQGGWGIPLSPIWGVEVLSRYRFPKREAERFCARTLAPVSSNIMDYQSGRAMPYEKWIEFGIAKRSRSRWIRRMG